MIRTCTPRELEALARSPEACQLIDVREYPEFAGGHLPGARLIPLGELDARQAELDPSRPIVLLCKGGGRAKKAAEALARTGCEHLVTLDGGTDAWIAAGLPVEREARAPWSLERQVRLVAGLLVLIGLFIPPWPFLSAFVSAGLVFAALTNTCGMALLLAKLPWNRAPAVSCSLTRDTRSAP